ncbi:MAG: DPP IV N-terminal domain-containing protein, partial [Rikenellaceae bacterium]
MQLKRLICAMLLSTTVATQAQELKSVSYDDIAQGQFAARGIAGIRSMKDGEHYTTQQGNAVIRHRYSDGAVVDTIFNVETQPLKIQIEGYSMSDDENMMLFPTQREPIYRHSSRSNFYVYDRVKDSLFTLSNNGKQQEATISPNGKYAAFVRENDLWYVDFDKHTEVRITYDGRAGEIINGIPDWVYEEEYSFSRAYQWSPSSDAIAYYRFDERNVKEYNMNYFGQELYPENVTFKYPKAGEENSKVQIKVYRLSSDRHTTINLGSDEDIYIPRIEWTELDDMLAVHRLNRLQNNYDLLLANTISGSAKVIYNEVDPKYIERIDDQKITFLPDGKRFIVKNENDGYMHLYLYDMTGRMINQITRGEWEVIDICGVDNRRSQIYYTSSEISPLQSNLYSINFAGTKKRLLSREGTNHISMSEGCKYYICHNSRLDQPTVATLHKSSGEQVRVLEDNAALVARLKEYALPSKELFSFTTPEGVSLNGYILKPVDFDSTAVYPLMMVQYSGPGSQSVADQ